MLSKMYDELSLDILPVMDKTQFNGAFKEDKQILTNACKMLFICPEKPSVKIDFLEKIVKAMNMELDEVYHIYPNQLNTLENVPNTIWFSGCEVVKVNPAVKIITSPLLEKIDGVIDERQKLWKQIKE